MWCAPDSGSLSISSFLLCKVFYGGWSVWGLWLLLQVCQVPCIRWETPAIWPPLLLFCIYLLIYPIYSRRWAFWEKKLYLSSSFTCWVMDFQSWWTLEYQLWKILLVRSYVAMPDLIDVWQGDPISIHWYKYWKIEPPTYLGFCHVFPILICLVWEKKSKQM